MTAAEWLVSRAAAYELDAAHLKAQPEPLTSQGHGDRAVSVRFAVAMAAELRAVAVDMGGTT